MNKLNKLKVTQCQGEGYEGCYCEDCVKELQKEKDDNFLKLWRRGQELYRKSIDTSKESIKSNALSLWQQLNESNLPYEDFVEIQEFILTLFSDIN